MESEEAARRVKKQGGDFVLLAVSPKALERLRKGGGRIDPSNPIVSGETLAELIKPERNCEGCDGKRRSVCRSE